jgi:hypothetical protein
LRSSISGIGRLVPAPKQHFTRDEKELLKEGAMPADWSPTKRRQKDLDATWTKKHGKRHFGYKRSVNVDKRVHSQTRRRHGLPPRQPALCGRHGPGQHQPGC